MRIRDSVLLGDARLTDAGYLEANARTARTGVQQYLGSEVGRDDLQIVNVWRDEAEVFNKASLETFSRIPITMGHPAGKVTADNWKELAVGTSGDEVLRDGEFLKIGLKITDAKAVKAVKDGIRELSVGYETVLVWEDGVTADGIKYQARQTKIIADHIAIVPAGRAGSEVRIGDTDAVKWGAASLGDASKMVETEKRSRSMTTRTIVVDGLSVELTDKDAQIVQRAVDSLTKRLADAEAAAKVAADAHAKALADKEAEHQKVLAAKDAELATKDAEIEKVKAQVVDGAALDKLVGARGDLIAKAKSIAPKAEFAGLADADIRKTAVKAALGDAAVDGKAEAYIDARFDILVEDAAKNDPVAQAARVIGNAAVPGIPLGDAGAAGAAHAKMIADMSAAWKGNQ